MGTRAAINEALNRRMNRRQFLAHVGVVLLAVVGVASILRGLGAAGSQADGAPEPQPSAPAGSGPYGGSTYSHR